MIHLSQTPSPSERFANLVTELFQTATIAVVGVLGILTIAATI